MIDYDNTTTSTPKSRSYLKIAAAYANVAMRAGLTIEELKGCTGDSINEAKARAFAVMTNLAFAIEVALKGKLSDDKKGHNLKLLFNKLPKCDQEQIKMTTKHILVIDDADFDEYLEICKNGFVEWRYFFEEDKNGKTYNYLGITLFLYAIAYCLITGETPDSILEPCDFKKRCYIGEWGFFAEKEKIKKEYREAYKIALEDGNGMITPADEEWLKGIRERLDKIEADIRRVEKQYYIENGII